MYYFLTTALEIVEGSELRSGCYLPRERHVIHFTEGWVDRRDGLDRCGKSGSLSGFDNVTVQHLVATQTELHRPTSEVVMVLKSESCSVKKGFQNRPCSDMSILSSNIVRRR